MWRPFWPSTGSARLDKSSVQPGVGGSLNKKDKTEPNRSYARGEGGTRDGGGGASEFVRLNRKTRGTVQWPRSLTVRTAVVQSTRVSPAEMRRSEDDGGKSDEKETKECAQARGQAGRLKKERACDVALPKTIVSFLPGACLIKQFSIFGRPAGAISLHAVATFSYRSGIGHPKADRRDSLFERMAGFKVHEAAIPSSLG